VSASIGTLSLKLVANPAGLFSGLNAAARRIGNFTAGAVASLGRLALALQGGSALLDLFSKPLKLAANLEAAAISFNTMLGSVEKGKKMMADLQKFALATPFGIIGATDAAKQLMAFGISADKVLPTMKVLGDLAQGDSGRFERLALVLGQVRATNKLFAQDTTQFANANINIIEALAKSMGKPTAEIAKLKEAGQITFNDVARALQMLTSEGNLFHNGMSAQLQGTKGQWQLFTEQVELALTRVGEAMIEGFDVKGLLSGVTAFVVDLAATIKDDLLPTFESWRQTLSEMWHFWAEAWASFGEPVFKAVSGWMGDTNKTWLEATEDMLLSIAKLVDGIYAFGEQITNALVHPFVSAVERISRRAAALADAMATVTPDWMGGKELRDLSEALRGVGGLAGELGEQFGEEFGLGAQDKVAEFIERVRIRMQEASLTWLDDLPSLDEFMADIGGPVDMISQQVPGVPGLTAGAMKLADFAEQGSAAAASSIGRWEGTALLKQSEDAQIQRQLLAQVKKLVEVTEKAQVAVAGLF
jgi:tape measure domain-containing protein